MESQAVFIRYFTSMLKVGLVILFVSVARVSSLAVGISTNPGQGAALTINSPVAGGNYYLTTNWLLNIGFDVGFNIYSLTWTNSAGGNGASDGADGLYDGLIGNIVLQPGDNEITLYVFDVNTNMVDAQSMDAIYTPPPPPKVSISSPVAGQRWSNSVFTVKGTASGALPITNIWYELNGGGWTNANATGTTNWTARVGLAPGTNVFTVYVADISGAVSTNHAVVAFDCVVTNQLAIQTIGLGTFSPNDSNAWLEAGRNYTVTAVPASGFGFVNWTNGLTGAVSNKASLTFTMQSNLVLTATFADVTRPVVTITNMPVGLTVSNAAFTVRGAASDNRAVGGVWVQSDTNGWVRATGTNAWNAGLTLVPGTNTVRAYAVDTSGNHSLTNSVSVVYAVLAQLQVLTNGSGTVTPNDNNAWLVVGRNYTLTATAAAGWRFYGWTGADSSRLTNGAALTFNMSSNLALTANFYQPVAIKLQPASTTGFYGGGASFTVGATGTAPLAYQWQFNSANLAGQTGATLELSSLAAGNAGSYRVIVSAYSNSVTSRVVTLTLTNAPAGLTNLAMTVTPAGGTPFAISFGAGTFSQFSTDTNNGSGVGNYEYAASNAVAGRLSLVTVAPPAAVDNVTQAVDLTFVSPGQAVFTNTGSGQTGTIQYAKVTNRVPADWNGHLLTMVSGNETNVCGFNSNADGRVDGLAGPNFYGMNYYVDAYTASDYSPVAGEARLTLTGVGAMYLQLQFTNASAGEYWSETYDSANNFRSRQSGHFTWQ